MKRARWFTAGLLAGAVGIVAGWRKVARPWRRLAAARDSGEHPGGVAGVVSAGLVSARGVMADAVRTGREDARRREEELWDEIGASRR